MKPAFRVRVSTVFIALSLLGYGLPKAIGWTPHDGGWPGVLFISAPMLAAIGFFACVVSLVKARTAQAWLELVVAIGILGVATLMFLF